MFICAPGQRLRHSTPSPPLNLDAAKEPCFASIGGLAVLRGSSAVLVESTIADCTASNSFGGGLLALEANVTLEGGSRIERCYAHALGGAMLAVNSKVALLNGSAISESYANVMGGGLHLGFGCTQSAPPRP